MHMSEIACLLSDIINTLCETGNSAIVNTTQIIYYQQHNQSQSTLFTMENQFSVDV